jgi:5-hydroxyisourate hydrolase-like protein (transthyretin family)
MRYVALLFLLIVAASAQTNKKEDSSSIEGRALNSVTSEPVGKASLLLMRTDSTQPSYDWARSYGAISDAGGVFVIRNIAPGKYRLRASRNGFITLEYGTRDSQRSGTELDLGHPQQLKGVDFRLTPHGVIAGTVLDADGEPLAQVQVQLLRSQYVKGKKVLATTNTASTNDLGEYRWAGLTPGKYYVYAEDFRGLPPASESKEEYVPVYYPGVANAAGAIPVEVAPGANVRGVDLMLRKAPTATVKGRVVIDLPDAYGTPAVRFSLETGHDNSAAGSWHVPSARVNASGEFEVRGLTPGSYTAMAEIAKGGRGYTGSTAVEVAGTDIEGVVITIGIGVSVSGRIRVEGETSQDLQGTAVRFQRGGPGVEFNSPGWTCRIARDRTFKIENLDPARYGVLIDGLPDGYYAKSIRVGEVEITYSGVDLTTGALGQVDILLSPKAGLVSGSVQNPKTGQPTSGVTVVLVPKEKERLAISTFYRETATDEHGRFTFKSVIPGEYKAYAWEDVEASAWLDRDFMQPFEDKGEPVTVGENARANVQVNLIPADSQIDKLK